MENSSDSSKLIQINNSLEELSKIIAQSLDDITVKKIIYQEINKKFDGDYDVLWKTIKTVKENELPGWSAFAHALL